MTNWRIEKIKSRFIKIIENIRFSRTIKNGNENIILLKIDKLGDYILFRNFIEEIYRLHHKRGKIILCGNTAVKDLADKLDSEFISDFIWIDVPQLENHIYR